LHRLGDRVVAVGDDGVPRSADGTHFVGSGATLGVMRSRCESVFDWTPDRYQKLFAGNASRWLRLG
jgi:hypothetical protein